MVRPYIISLIRLWIKILFTLLIIPLFNPDVKPLIRLEIKPEVRLYIKPLIRFPIRLIIRSPIPSPVCYTPFYKNKSLPFWRSKFYLVISLLYYKVFLEDVNPGVKSSDFYKIKTPPGNPGAPPFNFPPNPAQ